MTLTKLGEFLRNMRQAIKQYPKEMRAKGVYIIHIHVDVINIANIFNPLSSSIHIQILQTDLYTFP